MGQQQSSVSDEKNATLNDFLDRQIPPPPPPPPKNEPIDILGNNAVQFHFNYGMATKLGLNDADKANKLFNYLVDNNYKDVKTKVDPATQMTYVEYKNAERYGFYRN